MQWPVGSGLLLATWPPREVCGCWGRVAVCAAATAVDYLAHPAPMATACMLGQDPRIPPTTGPVALCGVHRTACNGRPGVRPARARACVEPSRRRRNDVRTRAQAWLYASARFTWWPVAGGRWGLGWVVMSHGNASSGQETFPLGRVCSVIVTHGGRGIVCQRRHDIVPPIHDPPVPVARGERVVGVHIASQPPSWCAVRALPSISSRRHDAVPVD